MTKILAIFTCYNRKGKTERCVHSLTEGNPECIFTFIAVDDGSCDGTRELLLSMKKIYDLYLLEGDGSLYYSGGMRKGMCYALQELSGDYDYLLMLNDDVVFFAGGVEGMIAQSKEQNGAVIAGAMCDSAGRLSYGAVKYIKGIKYRKLQIDEWRLKADTFNANAVLMPYNIFSQTGAIDAHYRHSLGDFDYGLEISRSGGVIYGSKQYIGHCEQNDVKGTWGDASLSRRERVKKKESVKGAPTRQWFYFLKKNFGVLMAVKGCCTPYVRIVLGR